MVSSRSAVVENLVCFFMCVGFLMLAVALGERSTVFVVSLSLKW